MQLLIATHNPSKKKELQHIFSTLLPPDIQLASLTDVGIQEDVEETGATFMENALLKATHYAKLSGLPTIADDGGICIDALHGEPGVHSKRWMGTEATDQELIAYCLRKMKGIPAPQRSAYFEVVLAFCDPQSVLEQSPLIYTAAGRTSGHIAETAHATVLPGFPYRALLIVDPFDAYYDELTPKQHAQVNHRVHAAESLAKDIITWYNMHKH